MSDGLHCIVYCDLCDRVCMLRQSCYIQEWNVHMKNVLSNEAQKLQADLDHTKQSIDHTKTSIDDWLDSIQGMMWQIS